MSIFTKLNKLDYNTYSYNSISCSASEIIADQSNDEQNKPYITGNTVS